MDLQTYWYIVWIVDGIPVKYLLNFKLLCTNVYHIRVYTVISTSGTMWSTKVFYHSSHSRDAIILKVLWIYVFKILTLNILGFIYVLTFQQMVNISDNEHSQQHWELVITQQNVQLVTYRNCEWMDWMYPTKCELMEEKWTEKWQEMALSEDCSYIGA